MELKVLFQKTLPADSKRRFWGVLVLFLTLWLWPPKAWAYPFNVDFSPSGYLVYDINSDFTPNPSDSSDCFDVQGRTFSFTAGSNFRLSGLSLFFFENYDKSQNIYDPQKLKVSVFSGDQTDWDKVLVWRAVGGSEASQNKSVSLYANGVARGLFFNFEEHGGPVWLEKSKNYSVLVECQNVGNGSPHKIYGASNVIGGRSFDSTTFTMAGADTHKKPYYQLFAKNDGLATVPPPVKTVPARRPVVLIHGLGGKTSDFSDWVERLKKQSWDSRYVSVFSFGNKVVSGQEEYDSFADLDKLPKKLRAWLLPLSALYRVEGGDGRVDLLGYSTGALVARNYLGQNKDSHRIRRFLALAGPFKGSFLADLEAGNEPFLGVKAKLPLSLATVFAAPLNVLNPLSFGRTPPSSDFKAQIVSTSSQVSSIKKEDLPTDVAYYSLQGDIRVQETQRFFKYLIKSEGSLGDGSVLPATAYELPLPSVSVFSFAETVVSARSVVRSSASVSARPALPDFSKLNFFHSNLLKAEEVKNKALDLLK